MLSALAHNPGFLIAHQVHVIDIVLLFCGLVFLPAIACLIIESVFNWSGLAVRVVHACFVALFTAVFLLVLLKNVFPQRNSALIAAAVVGGAIFAYSYQRWIRRHVSLALLSPVLLIFPISFFAQAQVRRILWPSKLAVQSTSATAPLVMIVFDEFPLSVLLGRDGAIDDRYFPHFAALSHHATWFRNTTAVSDSTVFAVPAILDGIRPVSGHLKLPNATDHPHSLFTLLGGSYRMNVHENITQVCPEQLCPSSVQFSFLPRMKALVKDTSIVTAYAMLPQRFTKRLPDITQAWGGFGGGAQVGTGTPRGEHLSDFFDEATRSDDRPRQVRDFIASIEPGSEPSLNFLHVLLPHVHWDFLPTCQTYAPVAHTEIRGLVGPNTKNIDPGAWGNDAQAAQQAYLRFVWQAQCVDTLVGDLVEHLKSSGMYDKSLLVITADHGASFRPNLGRRVVGQANQDDIRWVPLFVKLPGQTRGKTDGRNAETIDILPTIADGLGISPGYKVSGQSLIGAQWRDRGSKRIVSADGPVIDSGPSDEGLDESLRYKLKVFPGWDMPASIYATDRSVGLVGQPVGETKMSASRYRLDWPTLYQFVDHRSHIVPAEIAGVLEDPASTTLGVSVNGVFWGTTNAYGKNGQVVFSFFVPPTSLQDGANRIAVYALNGRELSKLTDVSAVVGYQLGTVLDFSEHGNAARYETEGWHRPDSSGLTWTSAKRSALFLPLAAPNHDVHMKMLLSTFAAPNTTRIIPVEVSVNGTPVGEWQVKNSFVEQHVTIPRAIFANRQGADISFSVPDAASPIALKAGSDERILGVGVVNLSLQ